MTGQSRPLAEGHDVTPAAAGTAPQFGSVEEMLAAARSGLDRLNPIRAAAAVAAGARFVDIRPAWQRAREGEIPGALVVERNHLEWRLHPESDSRLPGAVAGQRWIVFCSAGYTSSLAAASLRCLGLDATDLEGGFLRWQAEGFATLTGRTRADQVSGEQPSVDQGDLGGPDVEDVAVHGIPVR